MFIVIGTLSVLTVGIIAAAGVPSVLAIRSLISQIAEAQGKIDARYALRRYVRNSMTSLVDTKHRLGGLSGMALQEGRELDFVTAIENAASATGVDQQPDLQTVNQKQLSPWERAIPLRLHVTGDFPKVMQFLNAVERLPYAVTFTSIAIATPRQSSEFTKTGIVEADFQGTVYWQGQNAPDFVHGKADTITMPDDGKP